MLFPPCKNQSCAASLNEITSMEGSAFLRFLMNRRKELLMLVDEDDRYLGEKEKEECHRDTGCLHSAFLVMITNATAELMQARRSEKKRLWPHFWDGTVAGHFYRQENPEASIKRRVLEEIGVSCGHLEFLFKFRYQAVFKDIGAENEICHFYKADNLNPEDIALNPDEVSEYKFSSLPKLKEEIEATPEIYTPWFLIALRKL